MSTTNLPWRYRWVHSGKSGDMGELQVLSTCRIFGIPLFKEWLTIEHCYQANAKHYAERHYAAARQSGMEFTVQ